jgi:peptidoglycan-associated lipoprotein
MRRSALAIHAVVVVLLLLTGCAKRPTATQASVPAPGGSSGSTTAQAGQMGAAAQSGPDRARSERDGADARTAARSAADSRGADARAGARPATGEFAAVTDLKDVHFDFDKYAIRRADGATLDANAAWLKTKPGYVVLIEGHCDERGTDQYNVALGERRAKAAMNYLVSRGIQANRITIVSYGEQRPSCAQSSEACWASNRRAHFLVKSQ